MNSHNPLENVIVAAQTRAQPLEQLSGLQRSWEQPEVVEVMKKVEVPKKAGTYRIFIRREKK
jgi:hypothetical protein